MTKCVYENDVRVNRLIQCDPLAYREQAYFYGKRVNILIASVLDYTGSFMIVLSSNAQRST